MKVDRVVFNWYGTPHGDDYAVRQIGHCGVTSIDYVDARGEGDHHCCVVMFESGTKELIFNINRVVIEPEVKV